MAKLLIAMMVGLSTQYVNETITEMDSQDCNFLFPLSFIGTDTMSLIDWDLQNFQDQTTQTSPYTSDLLSYTAFIYKDTSNNLFLGATYESTAKFRWLKQITNAATAGSAAVKIVSSRHPTEPSIESLDQETLNSVVSLFYEPSDDSSLAILVYFDYKDGSFLKGWKIKKGVSAYTNKVVAQLVTAIESPIQLVVVLQFSAEQAIQITFEIEVKSYEIAMTPYQVFNYEGKGFSNTDFRHVIGISSASNTRNLLGFTATGYTTHYDDFSYIDGTICYKGPTDGLKALDAFIGAPVINSYHIGALNNQTAATRKYIAGTAFYNQVESSIYWYVTMKVGSSGDLFMYEYYYQLEVSSSDIKSMVVSNDAPMLVLTAQSSDGQNLLILDDISKAISIKEYNFVKQSRFSLQHYTGSCFTRNSIPDDVHKLDTSKTCLHTVGTQTIVITSSTPKDVFYARALNTEFYNLELNSTNSLSFCQITATVLVEQVSSSGGSYGVMHVLIIKMPKAKSQYDRTGYPDCTNVNFEVQSTISYKISSPGSKFQNYISSTKAFINSGFIEGNLNPSVLFTTIGQTGSNKISVISNYGDKGGILYSLSTTIGTSFDQLAKSDETSCQNPVELELTSSSLTFCAQKNKLQSKGDYQSTTNYTIDSQDKVTIELTAAGERAILLIDSNVTNGLLCVQVDPTTSEQKFITHLKNINAPNPQTLCKSDVISTDYNIWPYSTCNDRNAFDFQNSCDSLVAKTTSSRFGSYFVGWIDDPDFNIRRKYTLSPTIEIKFQDSTNVLEKNLYLVFQPDQRKSGTFGYGGLPVTFNYQLGSDLPIFTWEQQLLLMESCQPEDLVWQTWTDPKNKTTYPLEQVYYYSQGVLQFELPLPVVTNNNIWFSVDKQQYLDFSHSIYVSGTVLVPKSLLYNKIYIVGTDEEKTLFVNLESGINTIMNITVQLTSRDPYYYTNTTGSIDQSNITLSLHLLQLKVVNDLAPYFITSPISSYELYLPFTRFIIDLPDIMDDDSSFAYIQSINVVGPAKCSQLVQFKIFHQMTGNSMTVSSQGITANVQCRVTIILIDNCITPRTATYPIDFKVFVPQLQQGIEEEINFNVSDTSYNVSNQINLQVESIDNQGRLVLLWTLPMGSRVNPQANLTQLRANMNNSNSSDLVDFIPQVLSLSHSQYQRAIDDTVKMRRPTYTITNMTNVRIFLQITYPDQAQLSINSKKAEDYLLVTWNNTEVLLSQLNNRPAASNWTFLLKLKPQSLTSQESQKTKAQGKFMLFAMSSIMSSNFVINVLMSSSLSELWGQLNVMQLLLYTPLFELQLPVNVQSLCGALIQITTFDVLDSESITNAVFGQDNFSEACLEPQSDLLEAIGLVTSNFIYNFGTMYYIVVFVMLLTILAVLLSGLEKVFNLGRVNTRSCVTLGKINKKLWGYLTPNLYWRLFLESNFDLLINAYLQMQVLLESKSILDWYSVALAGLSLFLCFAIPVFTLFKVRQLMNQKKLHDKDQLYWYGELYEQFLHPGDRANRLNRLLYNFFYMVRRVLTVFSIFYIEKVVGFQIGCVMYMSIFVASNNIANRPYIDQMMNKIDAINEIIYYILLALSFSFTMNNDDEESKTVIGELWNGLLIGMMGFNGLTLIVKVIYQLFRRFQRFIIHRRLIKIRKAKRIQRLKLRKYFEEKAEKKRIEKEKEKQMNDRFQALELEMAGVERSRQYVPVVAKLNLQKMFKKPGEVKNAESSDEPVQRDWNPPRYFDRVDMQRGGLSNQNAFGIQRNPAVSSQLINDPHEDIPEFSFRKPREENEEHEMTAEQFHKRLDLSYYL